MKEITGGVTAAKGFQAASTAAGIKYKDRKDMAMIYSEVPCKAAGTFTTNVVKAAPVKWDHNVVYNSKAAQAVVINAGIANACTGEEGMGYCKQTAEKVEKVLGIAADEVLVASTGVIGMQLPIDRICNGIDAMVPQLKGGFQSDHDHRYKKQRGGSDHRTWWKNGNDRRHVQRLRHDPSEYVYDA